MSYKVKLDIFEGPFDLLVYLIERAEMNIYDIRVAEITREYLLCLDEMVKRDVAPVAEFMVLAATLIEIKSRMLLPRRATDDPAALSEDPRTELVEKILEYKKYKQAAELLGERIEQAGLSYTKPQEELAGYEQEAEVFLRLKVEPFLSAFAAFLNRQRNRADIRERYNRPKGDRMAIRTRLTQLKNLLLKRRRVHFRELFPEPPDRYQVVLTFLSVLEMVRRKTLRARQPVNFGDITLTPTAELAGARFDQEGEADYDESSGR